ncbi:DsbA family protein [Dietzia maris]|uniref:DsbA family protein n=1 Tax=Dietzia maris TaxID=37915 RepID=A0AAE4R207_9ACTN|nr:DsbA family protein [Dietzia maris]MDV6300863.1 DsbA family protein [Dietzia maris]
MLAILIILGVAMWRAGATGEGDTAAGGVIAQQQPDYSYAERREPSDPFAFGPVDAPVGLVVFSDYQCPFCAQWNRETLPVMKERAEAGELRIEWRDVNVYGPASKRAAMASYAAAEQGQFWEFHDALFKGGRTRSERDLSEAALIDMAGRLGMNTERFAVDMISSEASEEIARNEELGIEHGARATPVFILGGVPMIGAQPSEDFVDAHEAALESAGK